MIVQDGITNSPEAGGYPLSGKTPKPLAGPGGGGTTQAPAAGSADAISATDFLTLLVTEMRNQDPTAQTDPNAYINQLVQVNSLEQLISMNQNLASVLGVSNSSPAAGTDVRLGSASLQHTAHPSAQVHRIASPGAAQVAARPPGNGNLSIPEPKPAARAVAHALDGTRRSGEMRRHPAATR